MLVGRENCIWWIQFLAFMFPDFSVQRERAYVSQSLVCSSGSGILTLQSCLISSYLQICLSFVCKPMHAWGLEYHPLDIQLIQDWAAQKEGQSQFSWHATLWPGLPLLRLLAQAGKDRSPRHAVAQSQVCIFLLLGPGPLLSATGFRIPASIFFNV